MLLTIPVSYYMDHLHSIQVFKWNQKKSVLLHCNHFVPLHILNLLNPEISVILTCARVCLLYGFSDMNMLCVKKVMNVATTSSKRH